MKRPRVRQNVYAENLLAGLFFVNSQGRHYFRVDSGFTFNHPLDKTSGYAVLDPTTDYFVGIVRPDGLTLLGPNPRAYRVYLLRPLVEDLTPPPRSTH